MSNQSGKIVLVLVLILLILGAAIYFFLPTFKKQNDVEPVINYSPQPTKYSQEATSSGEIKDYYSKDFKMNLRIPTRFEIEDKFPLFTLKMGNSQIEISRNGTNFPNIEDYIQDFDSKRNIKEVNSKNTKIGDYSLVERELIYGDSSTKQKSDFLYVSNNVYIFSTSDEALYPVLDQIVQSFEYKP